MDEIVVGFDASKPAMEALAWAAEEAERRGASVEVVQSWHEPVLGGPPLAEEWADPGAEQRRVRTELEAVARRLAADHPTVTVTSTLRGDRPVASLLDAAEGAALHHVSCPVVVVPIAAVDRPT